MTPACVFLDDAGVDYIRHPYDHDPATDSYGSEAAAALGVDGDLVYKTLMAVLDTGELVVAIIPVTQMLNLKAIAACFGTKKANMAEIAAAERSSGYIAGGISPFGQRTPRRTAIDESASNHRTIFVSGGRRGLDIELDPSDLIALLQATTVPLVR